MRVVETQNEILFSDGSTEMIERQVADTFIAHALRNDGMMNICVISAALLVRYLRKSYYSSF